ncbi:alpha/beta fold hydrolase [Chitinophaga sp. CC14]|uniref:alpha/beta fold hydrolase n=1 Tax=Chitinophaga sp. CC14 TaxID=3029199 RepID=UPI003B818CCA
MKRISLLAVMIFTFLISYSQQLYVKTFGDPHHPAIVFIHGGPRGNSVLFEGTTAQKLAGRGFYVIVYDRRGEGRSSYDNAKVTYGEAFEDLNGIYKKFHLTKASLIGFSFGGLVTTLFAEKYPEKINAVVLTSALFAQQATYNHILDSVKRIYTRKQNAIQLKKITDVALLDKNSAAYRKACFALAAENGFFKAGQLSDEATKIYAAYEASDLSKKDIRNDQAPGLFYKNEKLVNIDVRPILAKLKSKGIAIFGLYGKDDGIFSSEMINSIQAIIGAEHFKYLDHASHYLFADRQDAFLNSIAAWLQETEPHINGPRVYGARPGKAFMYTIPATGKRPMTFQVKHLPEGVTLDKNSGVISGSVKEKGDYAIELIAVNKYGRSAKTFTLVIGDKLALTPPMGWSSWYSFGRNVTLDKVIRTAEMIRNKGLQQYGWSVIEIDDPWTKQPGKEDFIWTKLKQKAGTAYSYYEGPDNLPGRVGQVRNENGELIPNQYFTDIKAFPALMHKMGFKAGIYSSPGPLTCGGVAGSYGYEQTDAKFFADNGFDYLKYDWCSYGSLAKNESKAELIKPYRLMSDALQAQKRDIIHALCQYGMGNVWEWGNESGGQLWRTEGDIADNWHSVYGAIRKLADKAQYVKPGNWNDPDILQIGVVGAQSEGEAKRNHLTPDEQKTHFSMWCMLDAPLLIGANIELLDDFTLGLITNEEVIAVNQDALGMAAGLKTVLPDTVEVWSKPLEDGGTAVGLLNAGDKAVTTTFPFSAVGLEGTYAVRDLWEKKDLGLFSKEISITIPPHGIVLWKIIRKKAGATR